MPYAICRTSTSTGTVSLEPYVQYEYRIPGPCCYQGGQAPSWTPPLNPKTPLLVRACASYRHPCYQVQYPAILVLALEAYRTEPLPQQRWSTRTVLVLYETSRHLKVPYDVVLHLQDSRGSIEDYSVAFPKTANIRGFPGISKDSQGSYASLNTMVT